MMSKSVIGKHCFVDFMVKVTVWAHITKIGYFYCISTTADYVATKLSLMYIIIISWSVLWKDWIAVFLVMVTVMVENFTDWLSVQYFPCHWYLCNQTRYTDVLIVILLTRPSADKVGIFSMLTVTIDIGSQQGVLLHKVANLVTFLPVPTIHWQEVTAEYLWCRLMYVFRLYALGFSALFPAWRVKSHALVLFCQSYSERRLQLNSCQTF